MATPKPAKQTAAEAAAQPDPKSAAAPAKTSRKRRVAIAVALLALAGAGGGAWVLLGSTQGAPQETQAASKREPAKPPLFVPIETFIVNLQREGDEQYLQVNLTLRVSGSDVEDALKLHGPEIRNRILLVLAGKKASEVASTAGKQQLAEEITSGVNEILAAAKPLPAAGPGAKGKGAPPKPVTGVLFTSFIIQ